MGLFPPYSVCAAAGLYYLAELIEEYSVLAKKAIFSLSIVSWYCNSSNSKAGLICRAGVVC